MQETFLKELSPNHSQMLNGHKIFEKSNFLELRVLLNGPKQQSKNIMFWNILKYFEILENIIKNLGYSRLLLNVLKYSKWFRNILKFWNFLELSETFLNIQKFTYRCNLLHGMIKYIYIWVNVTKSSWQLPEALEAMKNWVCNR